jgi:CPA2 family monovalent cation:H+ antiporter-2
VDPWIALLDILALLAAAVLLGAIAERLGQSALIGYLLAGVLLGPRVLHVFESQEEVATAAELGVALLLFSIGLEFSWPRLRALGKATLLAGALQVVVTLAVAAGASFLLGLGFSVSLVVGAAVALSSTACVLRLLRDRVELDSVHGRDVLAILIIQDIAVIPLALMADLLGGGADPERSPWMRLLETTLWGGGLVLALFVLMRYVVPLLLGSKGVMRNRELAVLLAIVVGLGAAWASHAVGISPALGAFIAGMVLASSAQATQIRADVSTLRTLLLTLFFGSVGMLADPLAMWANLPLLLLLVVLTVVGKAAIVTLVLKWMGRSNRSALGAGLCLAQLGEFGIVILTMARGSVVDERLFTLLAGTTILTLLISPYLVAAGSRVARGASDDAEARDAAVPLDDEKAGVIVIGFGPAGRAVARALDDCGEPITVIEMSRHTAAHAEDMDLPVIVGDASHIDVLEHAHVERARAVVVTLPDPVIVRNIVELVRKMNPQATAAARVRYHRHRDAIERAGAHCIVDEEESVGEELGRALVERLAATR